MRAGRGGRKEVGAEEVDAHGRREIKVDMFREEEGGECRCEDERAGGRASGLGDGEEQEGEEGGVVLKVDVVDVEQGRMEEQERERGATGGGTRVTIEKADGEWEGEEFKEEDGEAEEEDCRGGGVIEVREIEHGWVEAAGREGEEALGIGEERGVVECPGTGVGRGREGPVPVRERQGMSQTEPVPVHFEVGRVVGRHERELEQGCE